MPESTFMQPQYLVRVQRFAETGQQCVALPGITYLQVVKALSRYWRPSIRLVRQPRADSGTAADRFQRR